MAQIINLILFPNEVVKVGSVPNHSSTNQHGVYIWGFQFNTNGNENPEFYPYYVGQAGGVEKSKTTSIKSRLDAHYNFRANYNVIKQEEIKEYILNGKLKTDKEINILNEKELLEYRENYFSYLNKESFKTSWFVKNIKRESYKGLDQLQQLRKSNSKIQNDIKFMQSIMYACWIPIDNSIYNTTDERCKIILELEKYVQLCLSKNKIKLSTQLKSNPSEDFKFMITGNGDQNITRIVNIL